MIFLPLFFIVPLLVVVLLSLARGLISNCLNELLVLGEYARATSSRKERAPLRVPALKLLVGIYGGFGLVFVVFSLAFLLDYAVPFVGLLPGRVWIIAVLVAFYLLKYAKHRLIDL